MTRTAAEGRPRRLGDEHHPFRCDPQGFAGTGDGEERAEEDS